MRKTTRLFQIISLLISAISIGLLIYSTWCGLGLTFDSYNYLSAANSFRDSGRLLMQNGNPYIVHAPLFPVLLSLLGEDPLNQIRAINLILFALTIVIVWLVIHRLINSYLLRIFSFAGIVLAVNIQMIYNFVWTEPLFLFLFSLHNWFLIRYLNDKKIIHLATIIIIAFFMAITRNAGIFIILPTALYLLFSYKNSLAGALLYLMLGSSGFLIWNLYTFFYLDGATTILNGVAFFSGIGSNLIRYLDVISCWALPSFIPGIARIATLLLAMFLLFLLMKFRSFTPAAKAFLFSGLGYILIMIIFIPLDKSDVERMLSVVYPWLMIGVFIILDIRIPDFAASFKKGLVLILCLWIMYVGIRTIKNTIMWHQNHCQSVLKNKKKGVAYYQL